MREEDEVFSQTFYKEASTLSALNKISTTIVAYRGSVKNPKWTDAEPGERCDSLRFRFIPSKPDHVYAV